MVMLFDEKYDEDMLRGEDNNRKHRQEVFSSNRRDLIYISVLCLLTSPINMRARLHEATCTLCIGSLVMIPTGFPTDFNEMKILEKKNTHYETRLEIVSDQNYQNYFVKNIIKI